MNTQKIPAWVPDWKDASAYKKSFVEYVLQAEGSTDQPMLFAEKIIVLPIERWPWYVWVWEFLRRNSEYQLDYKRCAELPTENHLMDKWCISTPQDPAKDDGYRILRPDIEMPPERLWIDKEVDAAGFATQRPSHDEPEHVTLRFDLRYSIDEQLKKANETLLFWRDHLKNGAIPYPLDKIQSKNHTGKLPLYLRAFDAVLAGVTGREIGETLFSEKSDVDDMISAAWYAADKGKEYVNGKYKDLIRQI